jgi:RimJ/RimL family protein N-acetyltransferase
MIIGDGIRFRGIEREDLPSFVRWLNDPEVRRGLSLRMPLSLSQEEEWFSELSKGSPYERPMAIEILPDPKKDEWVFVGNCGLIDIDWQNRQAEMGIHIGEKKYWNKGFGTKAVQLLLKHGFETLNLHRLWLRVFESNQRAIRSYEKAGFKLEGRFRKAQFIEGMYEDVMIMSMLQPEWQGEKKGS